jgi:hypothetical protein
MMALQQLQSVPKNGGAQSHDAPVGQAKPA